MARSFGRIGAVPLIEDWSADFTHSASERSYVVSRRDGKFFLRRALIGGRDVVEKEIHYVVGSGEHSRTYLHRKKNGSLVELPLSWYSERGGHWAMSPGYDRPNHSDFRREVPDSCLFCHNAYPQQTSLDVADGIDCQRCHGPGEEHVTRRAPILNPARLTPERQMEVCLQCHLESASRTIPDAIRRYGRGPYSYRPSEPLSAFTIYFDRDLPAAGDPITVNHSAYGLRQSKCFLRADGKLLCTTCHNPHRSVRGEDAANQYAQACRGCHASVHPDRSTGCASCHMPKRRAEDAIHVVITDHRIQRIPQAADLRTPGNEQHGRYAGPVKLYYPATLPDTPENRMYQAVAALVDTAKLRDATARLESVLTAVQPRYGEVYRQLADALRKLGRSDKAIVNYRRSIELSPDDTAALTALADLLLEKNEPDQAIWLLENAGAKTTDDPARLNSLAVAYARKSRFSEAEGLLRRALQIDDDSPLTWLNLGVSLQARGQNSAAAEAYRNALRLQPDFSRARSYLNQLSH